ncbi:MAG TPA: hypothetical protein VM901_12635 [Bdellovibrionota bacterium]|jgi:hypothetical protein|nr:hypothetical protein [Bdellovibrionota bacterium]
MKRILMIALCSVLLAPSISLGSEHQRRLDIIAAAQAENQKLIDATKESFRTTKERLQQCESELQRPPAQEFLKQLPEGTNLTELSHVLLVQEWNSTLKALSVASQNQETFESLVDFINTETKTAEPISPEDALFSILELAPLFPIKPEKMSEAALGAKITSLQKLTRAWLGTGAMASSKALTPLATLEFANTDKDKIGELLADVDNEIQKSFTKESLQNSRKFSTQYFERFNHYALNMRLYLSLKNEVSNVDKHLQVLEARDAELKNQYRLERFGPLREK